MAGRFGFDDDEEDVLAPKEPQVTSQDPEERKAARALRIKRRQEALIRAEKPLDEQIAEEEPGPIEQATASAAEELQRLALDGAAKVTNVKVTTDEREVIRRGQFFKKMEASMAKIEQEALDAQEQYEAISSNWDVMLQIKDPLEIDEAMKEQKHKCDELLAEKDELINALKSDLKRMDEAYYEDLEKQDNDIKELSERIEKQVTIMQRAYEKQLTLIELSINLERAGMVEHNNKRWEALYKQRDKEEVMHLNYKFEQLEEHKQVVEDIMWDHHEKFRGAKIELETLLQELQKELEKLKATCIINTEKIGYNYQVLKKREEENVFVRSQQKRKLNKMSDVANTLRTKIRKAAEDGAIEEIKADAEIVKLMQAMADLEKKCYHFSHVNDYKFTQVWRMSTAKCTELARELRQAEVALHAHILSEAPPAPPPDPPKSPLVAEKIDKNVEPIALEPTSAEDRIAKEKLVRHILQLVADNTGFLVEDRLLKLIEKYQLTSRNLCTLDSIFMALEIQAEEDIELLCKTFLNYAFCPICVGMEGDTDIGDHISLAVPSQDEVGSNKTSRGDRGASIRGRASIARSVSANTSRSHLAFKGHPEMTASDQELLAEADELVLKCRDPKELASMQTGLVQVWSEHGRGAGGASTSKIRLQSSQPKRVTTRGVTVYSEPVVEPVKSISPFVCPMGHVLEIEPMQVLTALGEFNKVFVPPEKRRLDDILDDVKPPDFSSPSRKVKPEEIEQYWAQWKNVFPPEKDKFWDGLLAGLNNYLPILQERDRLHEEVVALRERNAALRRLVRGALPELPKQQHKYLRADRLPFTASFPDEAPEPFARLPPI